MKSTWQFKFRTWVGASERGLLLVGLRRNSRGPWLKAEDVPAHVREWFDIQPQPGAAKLWTIPDFKSLEAFRERAHVKLQRSGGLEVKGLAEIEYFPEQREIPTLECMKSHCDGAHCGLGDWYPEIEEGIRQALKQGRKAEWTTGWYGSKKEIASACITHVDGKIRIEVSVSDDFDTEGTGEQIIPHTTNLEKIRTAIYAAWDQAEEDQRENRAYYGFSIHHNTRYKLHGETKGHLIRNAWVETLILPRGWGYEMDSPPGDNYGKWGFQGEKKIPKAVKEKLEAWANDWIVEDAEGESFTYKGWTIKPWDEAHHLND